LPQHSEIAVEALGHISQRCGIDGRSLAFPRPDFLPALGQACLPQISSSATNGVRQLVNWFLRTDFSWELSETVVPALSAGSEMIEGLNG
jgi:hypothetical protein